MSPPNFDLFQVFRFGENGQYWAETAGYRLNDPYATRKRSLFHFKVIWDGNNGGAEPDHCSFFAVMLTTTNPSRSNCVIFTACGSVTRFICTFFISNSSLQRNARIHAHTETAGSYCSQGVMIHMAAEDQQATGLVFCSCDRPQFVSTLYLILLGLL